MRTISKIPDPQLLTLLEQVSQVSNDHNIEFFVIGAMARDVIFEWVHDIPSSRRTRDVDLGLRVKSWDQYRLIKQALIDTGDFQQGREEQRLLLSNQIPLDIVPFGDIAEENHIRWPPDFAIEMDVAGFEDAHNAAIEIRLRDNPVLDIKFASLIGLAVMKLIAWSNRAPAQRTKDAQDLSFIIQHYLEIEGIQRITSDFQHWLDQDFDYEMASAQLLRVDIDKMASPRLRNRITQILSAEIFKGLSSELVISMASSSSTQNEERALRLIESLNKKEEMN